MNEKEGTKDDGDEHTPKNVQVRQAAGFGNDKSSNGFKMDSEIGFNFAKNTSLKSVESSSFIEIPNDNKTKNSKNSILSKLVNLPIPDYDAIFQDEDINLSLNEKSSYMNFTFKSNDRFDELFSKVKLVDSNRAKVASLLGVVNFSVIICLEVLYFEVFANQAKEQYYKEKVLVYVTLGTNLLISLLIFLVSIKLRVGEKLAKIIFLGIILAVLALITEAFLLEYGIKITEGHHSPALEIIFWLILSALIFNLTHRMLAFHFLISLAFLIIYEISAIFLIGKESPDVAIRLIIVFFIIMTLSLGYFYIESFQRSIFLFWLKSKQKLKRLDYSKGVDENVGRSAADILLSNLKKLKENIQQIENSENNIKKASSFGRSISNVEHSISIGSNYSIGTEEAQVNKRGKFKKLLELQEECVRLLTTSTNLFTIDIDKLKRDFNLSNDRKENRDKISSIFHFLGIETETVPDKMIQEGLSGGQKLFLEANKSLTESYEGFKQFDLLKEVKEPIECGQSYTYMRYFGKNPQSIIGDILDDLDQKLGYDFNFDFLKLERDPLLRNNILVEFGLLNLMPNFEAINGKRSPKMKNLLCLLHMIQENYHMDVPYHNQFHAVQVTHHIICLLNKLELLIPVSTGTRTRWEVRLFSEFQRSSKVLDKNKPVKDILPTNGNNAFIIISLSALAHDVGHPGRNNNYFANTYNSLAIMYNDKSILENFHSSLLFRFLKLPQNNVFSHLCISEWRYIRKKAIEMILATDMSQHFDFIGELRARKQGEQFKYMQDEKNFWLLAQNCLKLADIGHSFLSWDIHKAFSNRILEEINNQLREEELLGLVLNPICYDKESENMAESQINFLSLMVLPLIKELATSTVKGDITECLEGLYQNLTKWKEEKKKREKKEVENPLEI